MAENKTRPTSASVDDLYINKLDDIDLDVLRGIVTGQYAAINETK
jgi:hypothetical protein